MTAARFSSLPHRNPPLLVGAVVLGLFAVSLGAGLAQSAIRAAMPPALLLVAGLAVLAAVAFTLQRIEIGVLLLPVVAVAVPFSIGTGTASAIVAALLLVAFLFGVWIARMLIQRDLRLLRSPVNLPLLGFVVTVVLSTINSEVVRPPLVVAPATWTQIQMGGLSTFLASAATLLVVMNSIRELRWLRRLTWTFLATGGIALVGYFLLNHNDLPGFSIGGLYSLWLVALALGQVLYNDSLPKWARIALLGLAAGWFLRRLVFESDWLSGWVPMYLAVMTLCFLRSKRLFALALIASAVVALVAGPSFYESQVEGSDSQGNFLRLDLWAQNLEVTRDNLPIGTGPAGYALYYETFFRGHQYSSHSNYLDLFAETGLIGTFFFIWLLTSVFRIGLKARQAPDRFTAGFASAVVAAMVGLVVAAMLGDWVIPFVYNQTIAGFRFTVHSWVFMGALAALPALRGE